MSNRYDRQVMIIGREMQERLSASRVFIAGAGGLGSPVATYLGIAGVGELAIADCDHVEETNLNRQFVHSDADMGCPKADSAAGSIRSMNPEIIVRACNTEINGGNVERLIRGYDLVIDALDNYDARYILNRAVLDAGTVMIHGAVCGWSGQVTTIVPGISPCLKCIIPAPPPEVLAPVMGTTAGVIGSIQANEALRYLLYGDTSLAGRLFVWDGTLCSSEEIRLDRLSGCPECGGNKSASVE